MYMMREGLEEDRGALRRFLRQANMKEDSTPFFIVSDDDEIVGTVGYERIEKDCLLKTFVFSLTVDKMVFVKFFSFVLGWLQQRDVDCVYLVTKGSTTIQFFEEFGFTCVQNVEIPKSIETLDHYQVAKQQENSILLACNLFTKISTI
jgi:N-acetylglutamate synthase-like GNAT family acetyltransferase